jgi:hypothetical protein
MRVIELTNNDNKEKIMLTVEHISVLKIWEGITSINTTGGSFVTVKEDYETVKRYILEGQD